MGCETETSIVKRVLTDRVLTDETRLALLVRILWLWHLMLGVALDAVHLISIMEGVRRRRLVIVIGARSTNTHTHEATMWLLQWLSVQSQWLCDSWSVGPHRPHRLCSSVSHRAPQSEAEKTCVDW